MGLRAGITKFIGTAILAVFTLHAGSVDGLIVIKRKLTKRNVTPTVAPYQRGTAVPLGTTTSEEDPLSFERARVVIYVEGRGPAARPTTVTLEQKERRFYPDLVVIPAGSSVSFPNLDPIFHNAFSNFNGQIFDLVLYPPGTSKSVTFRRPGIVRVFCNIHPSMSAIIVVVNSNYFATTDEDGQFTIEDVPPGNYQVHFFHERATPDKLAQLTTPIVVSGEDSKLQTVSISETGYLPVAHKNKYGRDYPPEAGEQTPYSGLVK